MSNSYGNRACAPIADEIQFLSLLRNQMSMVMDLIVGPARSDEERIADAGFAEQCRLRIDAQLRVLEAEWALYWSDSTFFSELHHSKILFDVARQSLVRAASENPAALDDVVRKCRQAWSSSVATRHPRRRSLVKA